MKKRKEKKEYVAQTIFTCFYIETTWSPSTNHPATVFQLSPALQSSPHDSVPLVLWNTSVMWLELCVLVFVVELSVIFSLLHLTSPGSSSSASSSSDHHTTTKQLQKHTFGFPLLDTLHPDTSTACPLPPPLTVLHTETSLGLKGFYRLSVSSTRSLKTIMFGTRSQSQILWKHHSYFSVFTTHTHSFWSDDAIAPPLPEPTCVTLATAATMEDYSAVLVLQKLLSLFWLLQ